MTEPAELSQADGMRYARNAAQAAASAGAVGNAELALQVAGLQESVMAQAEQLRAAREEIGELTDVIAARDEALAEKDAELARMAQINHGLQQRAAERFQEDDEVAGVDESAGSAPDGAAGER